MGVPFEMPPWMPPELLVFVVRRWVGELEFGAGPPNPVSISNPFVAGILSIAWASMASSLSKTGSPRPIGQLRTTQVTVPPMLSFASRKRSMIFFIRTEASASGQRTGTNESTCSRVIDEMREMKAGLVEGVGYVGVGERGVRDRQTRHRQLLRRCGQERYFSAIEPAATRPRRLVY